MTTKHKPKHAHKPAAHTHKHKSRKDKPSLIDSIISDIEKARLFKLIASSFKRWYKNWPWVLLSVLTDLIFVVSLSSMITVIQFTLFEHLEALMKLAGTATGGVVNIYNQTEQVAGGLSGLTQDAQFQFHLTEIFKYLGFMVILAFILWIILQGISWYIAYRISTDKRQGFLLFWKNFALQSFPFFFITILWIFLSVRILFSLKISIAPIISPEALNFLFALLVIITWYFGSLCYTITTKFAYKNFKQSFTYGTKKFPKTIQSFLFIALIFFLIDLILRIGFIRNDTFVLTVIGLLVFMPTLVFARILLFKTTQEYHSSHKK